MLPSRSNSSARFSIAWVGGVGSDGAVVAEATGGVLRSALASFHHGCRRPATPVGPGFAARLWHNDGHPPEPPAVSRTAAVLVAALALSPAAAQETKADLLPFSKLAPAKVRPNQCVLT